LVAFQWDKCVVCVKFSKNETGKSWEKGRLVHKRRAGEVAATGSFSLSPGPDSLAYTLINNVLTAKLERRGLKVSFAENRTK
jgi:hypothetical protein